MIKLRLFAPLAGCLLLVTADGSFALGELDRDYVYTAVVPCRIVDTRPVSGGPGPIPPGGTKSFFTYGSGALLAPQGGDPAGCPSPRGEPRAVHINVVAVPQSNGNLQVYPFGAAPGIGALVNYKLGTNIANAATVASCFGCASDITVQSNFGTANVVIDVLGYYHEVDPSDLVEGNHAGWDSFSYIATPFYTMVAEPFAVHDDTPSNGPPGTGDLLAVEDRTDVLVWATMQVFYSDDNQEALLAGEITPCYRAPGGPPEEVILCENEEPPAPGMGEGPEGETDFCILSRGFFDQKSVQTSCLFRDMPAGIWEFGVCAKTGSDYPPPCDQQALPYAIGGHKVNMLQLPQEEPLFDEFPGQ
jgi:hypothetical protein